MQSDVVNDATSEDLIDVIRAERCRVLKRIPKASRIPAAEKMSAILERIIANPDEPTLWSDLLRFTHACLAVLDVEVVNDICQVSPRR